VAILLGVDRFMSEARAITNLIGNGAATLVVARSERAFDEEARVQAVAELHEERLNAQRSPTPAASGAPQA
jgi:aerobic C4-dicarboxylate transport protein